MSDIVLDLRQVAKSFKRKMVLKNVDLQVSRGSIMGLLGKNGAGKTTLIKCALGLLEPQAGDATLLGESSRKLSAATKARIGYAPQVPDLFGWMRVRQLLAYTGAFYPTWDATMVTRLVDEWELDPEARVSTLSLGEAQKLSVLAALGHQPEVLVLDEPAAGLDPGARRRFLSALLDIVNDGQRTILFSTHFTPDLERVADQVAMLKDGRIVSCGSLDELKDSVKRLHISAREPLPRTLELPGTLREEISGHEATITSREVSTELVRKLEKEFSATVDVHDLNLEEIFMEMHHG